MDNEQYAELFLTESREHITAVNQALLELEQGGGGASATAAVGAIFRSVHTIKGMGATMGYAIVAELAHELETVLDRVRRNELAIDGDVTDVLFRAADVLEQAVEAAVAGREGAVVTTELVERLRGMVEHEAGDEGWTVDAPPGDGTLVRVRLAPDTPLKGVRAFIIVQALGRIGEVTGTEPPLEEIQIDGFDADFALRLLTPSGAADIDRVARSAGDVTDVQVGEDEEHAAAQASAPIAAAPRSPTPTSVAAVPQGGAGPGAVPGAPAAAPARSVRIDVRRLDNLMNLIGELVIARGRLTQLAAEIGDAALEETVSQSSRLITELRDEITASRMVPVSHVFDRFPRVVRDAARAVGKQVEFIVEGKDIELDRSMLDEIGDSIVHLLRNSIDHGLEMPAVREAAGKSPVGRLTLSAVRDRSAVVIKVSDDGKGIDRDKVLARAKRDGLVDEHKTDLSPDELLRLIARPGFSTAEKVTDLSGRGVGVDAVYTRVRSLGGAMDIRSVQGQGTTMLLRLPLTLAIVRALLARVADETYAIPLVHVNETIELTADVVRTVKGREVLLARDEVLPLLRLRSLVDLPAYEPRSDIDLEQVVVIDVGDRRAGLVIDELTGQEEIVVKQYDAVHDGPTFFGGATLLGDGTPSLIVDVSSLL
ncbi:MAG TPA: chemotaxis protein CheA [Gemmatimonadaceae bacterium]|nr:chemotaxis protein CheA [Gemmatimonadaceae bacterium]